MALTTDGLVLTDEFRHALELLAGGRHVFLTGKAGTGKSTLIRRFMAETDRNVVVVAPTGIAALNVDGYTIHRLFGFRTTTTLDDVRSGAVPAGPVHQDPGVAADADHRRGVDGARRRVRHGRRRAGAVRAGSRARRSAGCRSCWWATSTSCRRWSARARRTSSRRRTRRRTSSPPTVSAATTSRPCRLTTVFRQLGDDRMTAILNEIREGVLLGHAQEQLNARADADFVPPDDEFWLTLAPTNRLVTARNRQHLERLPGDELVHHARVSGDLSLFDPPVEETLRFKVGAQVMMLNNDQGDRWVNGTIGRVVGVDYDRYGAVVDVEFADGTLRRRHAVHVGGDAPGGRRRLAGPRGDRHVHAAAVQAGVGDHDPQEPGPDAGPPGRRPDRRHVLDGPALRGVEPLHVVGRAGAEKACAAEGSEDRPAHRAVPAHLGQRRPAARRYCAIGMLTVGDEGRMSRPRPVELAVAFDDGTAVTTLINPQRDLADARKAFGISVSDVLLAPTLREAWAVIAPMLAGCTPVGVGVDETLGLIDFELKRLGHVTAMPLGVELRGARVSGRTALERAQSALEAHGAADSEDGSSAFEEPEPAESISGLLVSRDHSVPTPAADHLPGLSALLRVSRDVGAVLLGACRRRRCATARTRRGTRRRGSRWPISCGRRPARAQLPAEVVARLREAVEVAGRRDRHRNQCRLERDDIGEALVPGARICFTGTAQDGAGRIVEREEMEQLAVSAGLTPVQSVTKTRCEVLVTAEAGTQSGKARKAAGVRQAGVHRRRVPGVGGGGFGRSLRYEREQPTQASSAGVAIAEIETQPFW